MDWWVVGWLRGALVACAQASFELWRFWASDSGLVEAESCVIVVVVGRGSE